MKIAREHLTSQYLFTSFTAKSLDIEGSTIRSKFQRSHNAIISQPLFQFIPIQFHLPWYSSPDRSICLEIKQGLIHACVKIARKVGTLL